MYVSNSQSREHLMSSLSKLMNIDFYGFCGTFACPKRDEACYIKMNQTYKFYLSFENSLCEVKQLQQLHIINMSLLI